MFYLYTMIQQSLTMQQQICEFQKTAAPKTDSLNLVNVEIFFSWKDNRHEIFTS